MSRRRRPRPDPKLAEHDLAAQFDLAGVAYVRQFPYVQGRRITADFLLVGTNVLVEIQGGVYPYYKPDGSLGQGAHGSVKGIKADNAKLNAATLAGWRVLRYTPDEVGTLLDPASQIALSGVLELLATALLDGVGSGPRVPVPAGASRGGSSPRRTPRSPA